MSYKESESMNELALIQKQVMELLKNLMLSESLGIWTEVKGVFTPTVDLFETDEDFICLVELPGIKKENIKVYIEDNSLYIVGSKKMTEKADAEYICIERVFGQFSRSITIPKPFNRFKSKTVFSDGLLKVIIPKISSDRRTEAYVLEIQEE
jgi:HSP20 family protein